MYVLSESGPVLPLTFYIGPNDLPLKGFWILGIRRRDLGLHRVVLTMAKHVQKSSYKSVFEKIKSELSRC